MRIIICIYARIVAAVSGRVWESLPTVTAVSTEYLTSVHPFTAFNMHLYILLYIVLVGR